MKIKLTPYLQRIVVSEQHGFLHGRSAVSNLFTYMDFLVNAVGSSTEVHSVYTDFNKPFDKINHAMLLQKMSAYGVCFGMVC